MHVEIENNAIILYTVGLSSQVAIYSYFCVMMHSWILMAAQYLIVRNVVCHSTGLVYVRQHLDRMLEAGASWTTFIRWRWFIFLNEVQKVRRYRGVRRVPSLCLSQYGSAERLSEYQKTVPETQYWPTCLGRLRATLQLCWIAVQCKASPDELYSSWKSAAAQTQQEVCRLMLKRWTQVK